jgi:hypothetical protein
MQREILALVNDFEQWRGNSYTLATLIAVLVKEKAAEKAAELGSEEVAEAIRGL